MKITRERAIELGLITCAEDCINCEFCTDCHDTDSAEAINVALKTGYECPSLDEERLRSDMTKEEYDAWRHGRLEWAEEKAEDGLIDFSFSKDGSEIYYDDDSYNIMNIYDLDKL